MSSGSPAPASPFGAKALLRLSIAAALMAYVFWRADPRAVLGAFAGLRGLPLATVVLLVLIDRVLMAHRWFVLLRPIERERMPPRRVVLEVFFVSTFVGTFLPGSIGGDAARAYSLARHGVPIADSMASVFVDRMMGVLSLLIMAAVALTLASDLAANGTIAIGLAATFAACAATALVVFSSAAEDVAERLLGRLPWPRIRRGSAEVLGALRRYAHCHGPLLNVLAASLAVQILRILQAYLLGTAIGVAAPLTMYFAFVPLIMLIMLLPISVNGIGTSQAAFVWFFARVGTPEHQAFVLSVLFVALQIIGNIPGAIAFTLRGFGLNRTEPSRQ